MKQHHFTITILMIMVATTTWAQTASTAITINSVQATVRGKEVLVSWNSVPPTLPLLIFRSGVRFQSIQDLRKAVLLNRVTATASPYHDLPPPGLEFYYAVVPEESYVANTPLQGIQATSYPTMVTLTLADQADQLNSPYRPPIGGFTERPLPLPEPQSLVDPLTGDTLENLNLPQDVTLSPAVSAILGPYSQPSVPRPLPQPTILDEEQQTNLKGFESELAQIVQTSFKSADWAICVTRLQNLESLPLEPATQARVWFYLAQSLAYLGENRQAVLALLSSNPDQALKTAWLDALVDRLPDAP